ncbi:hypothetical protein FHW96_004162 [Novosphingobium sp. SG751A]|uniref:hypothetical protein n=1 Tax=Novosphingobium sp. SG751A TaxID=2587000 RepID=UPI001C12C5C9|nr:hypothetical protein [Novosphingobium sp. SG751A]NOW47978.1 hypothetical protein [Novosphingobium sp. SG751A]
MGLKRSLAVLLGLWSSAPALAATSPACDKTCLEQVAATYRAAYLAHDPKRAPLAAGVRFSENNVEMALPDGTWSTVAREIGPALTVSDPVAGQVGIYTSIQQNDVQGFLAIRLKVRGRKITEVEHIISTKRNLSAPPTPIGPVETFVHNPDLALPVPPGERMGRRAMVALADGYFTTLENNDGAIRNTRFAPDAKRYENGMEFPEIEKNFRAGRYRFNERVRDREYFLIDEARGIVMSRAFIDHKGVLDAFELTDGTKTRSIFREPQSWSVLELFKIKGGQITAIEATFIQVPYYMRSPWTPKPDRRKGGLSVPPPMPATSAPASTNPPL